MSSWEKRKPYYTKWVGQLAKHINFLVKPMQLQRNWRGNMKSSTIPTGTKSPSEATTMIVDRSYNAADAQLAMTKCQELSWSMMNVKGLYPRIDEIIQIIKISFNRLLWEMQSKSDNHLQRLNDSDSDGQLSKRGSSGAHERGDRREVEVDYKRGHRRWEKSTRWAVFEFRGYERYYGVIESFWLTQQEIP